MISIGLSFYTPKDLLVDEITFVHRSNKDSLYALTYFRAKATESRNESACLWAA